jgi:hypothetical protein
MQMNKIYLFLLFLLIFSCIEPYDFVIRDSSRSLVIEALISDKSFSDTQGFPSDGRYFSVTLTYSGDVVNHRPEPVSLAAIILYDDLGSQWQYTETSPGMYLLLDNEFKALPERQYKLTVKDQEDIYESEWEALPQSATPPMGEIGFTETEKDFFVVESSENVLRTKKGIEPFVDVPVNETGEPLYYMWQYEPTWIYVAPLVARTSPGGVCWAKSPFFLNEYALQEDNVGGYKKGLFFLETIRNIKLFEKFSLLVTQYSLDTDYYFFWKEMKDRATGVGINETPPYNLKSNYTSINPDKKVFGYFGVAQEQAKRWYFDLKQLSYNVENTLKADCLVVYGPGPPAPECTDCREYTDGVATNQRPSWWPN